MGIVGTKFGPKFDKVDVIGVQIRPPEDYRGWIVPEGGFGPKNVHIVWDGVKMFKKNNHIVWEW